MDDPIESIAGKAYLLSLLDRWREVHQNTRRTILKTLTIMKESDSGTGSSHTFIDIWPIKALAIQGLTTHDKEEKRRSRPLRRHSKQVHEPVDDPTKYFFSWIFSYKYDVLRIRIDYYDLRIDG